jgi:hypothetical protein
LDKASVQSLNAELRFIAGGVPGLEEIIGEKIAELKKIMAEGMELQKQKADEEKNEAQLTTGKDKLEATQK